MFYRISVFGAVQGAGFRPFVFREAKKRGLKGYVKNTSSGVEVLVNDASFIDVLKDEHIRPGISEIDDVRIEAVEGSESFFPDFEILPSKAGTGTTRILPDIAACSECVSEIRDQKNRRKGYYFATCTNCGPRFSMIYATPYDRSTTSMSEFPMCEKCAKEYADPANRRYHAQTIACPDCGPKIHFSVRGERKATSFDAIKIASEALKMGKIIAIKGIGGFHLACDARNERSVMQLRAAISRQRKPLAIMAQSAEEAKEFVHIDEFEEKALVSGKRPIVVLRKKNNCGFPGVSSLDSIGVMLPYTALHHIILDELKGPLVMTSCNQPGEPIETESQNIASAELSNERKIANRADDSVLKFVCGKGLFLRRSRGYAPAPLDVGFSGAPDMIAMGAQESNSITVFKGGKAYISQHIGDCESVKTSEFMKKTADFFMKTTTANPRIVLCDMHPEYNTTQYAKHIASSFGAKLVPVQHHMAHAHSVALENGISSFAGIACDGLGYGLDGTLWGGEVFVFDAEKNRPDARVGHLEEQALLGGDMASREPERMLFGILSRFLGETETGRIFGKNSQVWGRQLLSGFNTPNTTSCGRVLDAAAYFLGVCDKRTYSGEPAMSLEAAVLDSKPYDLEPMVSNGKPAVLSTTRIFEFLWENKDKEKGRLAATVHDYLARGLLSIAEKAAGGLPIVFSGGVAYNRYITGYMLGNGVVVNSKVPAGDGGISFGQIGYALNNIDTL